jgi:hypothetical protein
MVEFLLSLPELVGAAIAMALVAFSGVILYVISSTLISKHPDDSLIEPGANLFRLAALFVGLMLSFAFADVMDQKRAIDVAIQREAVAILDTAQNLQTFGSEEASVARDILIKYTRSVIDDEWSSLADDQLSQRTEDLRKQFSRQILDLKTTTRLQEEIRSAILDDIDLISDHRLIRWESALAKPPIFVYIVMAGFLVSMVCFGVYRPQTKLIALILICSVFIGFMIYLVLALSDPYQGAFSVEPAFFEDLLERLKAESS